MSDSDNRFIVTKESAGREKEHARAVVSQFWREINRWVVPSLVAGALAISGCSSEENNNPSADISSDMDAGANEPDVEPNPHRFEDLNVSVQDGRPFIVDGQIQHSCMEPGAGWASQTPLLGSDLSEEQRATLSAHWTRIARGEHASIASFGRFTLELLQLGAPQELLRQTADALRDEVEHAHIAISLASSYSGQDIAPGPLAVSSDNHQQRTAAQILTDTILGGCINETLAVAQLRRAADTTKDPKIRGVLEQLATDESRHAALAWQTAAWMLETWPELVETAREAFANASVSIPTEEVAIDPLLADHGYLSPSQQRLVIDDAMNKIVTPCKQALLNA